MDLQAFSRDQNRPDGPLVSYRFYIGNIQTKKLHPNVWQSFMKEVHLPAHCHICTSVTLTRNTLFFPPPCANYSQFVFFPSFAGCKLWQRKHRQGQTYPGFPTESLWCRPQELQHCSRELVSTVEAHDPVLHGRSAGKRACEGVLQTNEFVQARCGQERHTGGARQAEAVAQRDPAGCMGRQHGEGHPVPVQRRVQEVPYGSCQGMYGPNGDNPRGSTAEGPISADKDGRNYPWVRRQGERGPFRDTIIKPCKRGRNPLRSLPGAPQEQSSSTDLAARHT